MELKARAATIGDLETVFGDISGRLSENYAAAGLTLGRVQDSLMMDLREGRAHTLLDGDLALAVITWHETDVSAETSFAARDGFFSASTVRFCRRHIRHIQALTGNLPIISRSWLEGPEIDRWFRIIGYEQKQDGDVKLFELPPA